MSRRTATITAGVAVVVIAAIAAVLLWPRPSSPTPTASPAISTTPEPTASLARDAPVVVFIGDSYTAGTGTSLDGTGFPAILGGLRGWEVVNLAIPGTGYSTGREDGRCPQPGCNAYIGVLPEAVSFEPDIVIVSGGRNDLNRPHLEQAVVTFYTELRERLPDVQLVVTSPLWDDSPTPAELVTLRQQVEREATRVGAAYLDLGDMFSDRPELIAPDDLHPNEEGLALIAQRIHELLP